MPLAACRLAQRKWLCYALRSPKRLPPPIGLPLNLEGVRPLSLSASLQRAKGNSRKNPRSKFKDKRKPEEHSNPKGPLNITWGRDGSKVDALRRIDMRSRGEIDVHEVVNGRLNMTARKIKDIWKGEQLDQAGVSLEQAGLLFQKFKEQIMAQDFEVMSEDEELFKSKEFEELEDVEDGEGSEPDMKSVYIPTPDRLKFYHQKGEQVLDSFIRDTFCSFVLGEDPLEMQSRKEMLDLRYPHEWFPEARCIQRKWIVHVGPTNSGKTYRALKRLEECETGIFAGPLRLLAHEIYERFNAKGISCNLVTGEEQKLEHVNPRVTSSTVEMIDLSRIVDVAVLDEIQMIGDEQRGWAWTQALLGVKAKEVHMCGEERTVDLIKSLAEITGDELVINQYQRLGPLFTAKESLNGDLSLVEKGDCVVTFSRKDIFALKRTIEEKTGKRVAVVYGGLPPETRSQQAKLFNEHNNEYDILVASDAVGMGLNLAIQRVIFETLYKYDGKEMKMLEIPHIKQIGGRAGRFKVAPHSPSTPSTRSATEVVPPLGPLPPPANPGMVTTLEKIDLLKLQYAMKANVPPIKTAGIHPPDRIIERFAKTFDRKKPFSNILAKVAMDSKVDKNLFHLCSLDDQIYIAGVVDKVKDLSVKERITITQAPLPKKDPDVKEHLVKYATLIAKSESGSILQVEGLNLDVLDEVSEPMPSTGQSKILSAAQMTQNHKSFDLLPELETLHKTTMLWLWLSYRFPTTFVPRETASEVKRLTEEAIQQLLDNMRYNRTKKLKYKLRHETQTFSSFGDAGFSEDASTEADTFARATA